MSWNSFINWFGLGDDNSDGNNTSPIINNATIKGVPPYAQPGYGEALASQQKALASQQNILGNNSTGSSWFNKGNMSDLVSLGTGLFDAYNGMQQNKLAKNQYNTAKQYAMLNYLDNQNNIATQKKVYNTANEDKLRARGATEHGDSGYYNDRIHQTNLY